MARFNKNECKTLNLGRKKPPTAEIQKVKITTKKIIMSQNRQ